MFDYFACFRTFKANNGDLVIPDDAPPSHGSVQVYTFKANNGDLVIPDDAPPSHGSVQVYIWKKTNYHLSMKPMKQYELLPENRFVIILRTICVSLSGLCAADGRHNPDNCTSVDGESAEASADT